MTNPLMEYLPPAGQPQQPQPQVQGAGKYHGAVATGYDAKRENDPKWIIEQKIITGMLDDLPEGSLVFDCPVGTGRFLPFYIDKGFTFIGMDLSTDMLSQAGAKVQPLAERATGELRVGDVRNTQMADKSVDAVVNCRITRWLSPADCQVMLKEMQRIARQRIIWTARVANHPHARTLELFEAALDGWKIVRNEAGSDLDYRILMAVPA
jgi:ubiquinone/menaquinone biosynthesis C-methylase UbiE